MLLLDCRFWVSVAHVHFSRSQLSQHSSVYNLTSAKMTVGDITPTLTHINAALLCRFKQIQHLRLWKVSFRGLMDILCFSVCGICSILCMNVFLWFSAGQITPHCFSSWGSLLFKWVYYCGKYSLTDLNSLTGPDTFNMSHPWFMYRADNSEWILPAYEYTVSCTYSVCLHHVTINNKNYILHVIKTELW